MQIRLLLAALAVLSLMGPEVAAQAAPEKVIVDNDFAGPGGSNLQSILFFLGNPKFELLGLTVVTGDAWRDEETAHVLRLLEIAGHPEVPVYNGAVFPLINTPTRAKAWETEFGRFPWRGAWNASDPYAVPPLKEGAPSLKPAPGNAAQFLIEQVHKYPHQVSILAAGPLTNLALAIRLDPEFASLAKQLVFEGGVLDSNIGKVTGSTDFNTDFNLGFDPESAHIVLTADWPSITSVSGGLGHIVPMDKALVADVGAKDTALTRYLVTYAWTGLPLWDEVAAAVLVDPSIVKQTITAYMDVDLEHGYNYGQAHVWSKEFAPGMGERPVTLVRAIDGAKFRALFLQAAHQEFPH
jgi:inosine-uridine nucleoside N-ribohydrolase